MSKSAVAIAGVVAGAAILAAIMYFQPQTLFPAREPFTSVTIDGLKDTYRIGEPIDFTVSITGYGCDVGFPSVLIKKANQTQEEIVWSRIGEIRSFPPGASCPLEDIHQVRHIGDLQKYNNDDQERARTQGGVPIVINKEGRYAVQVMDGNVRDPVVKEFTVTE